MTNFRLIPSIEQLRLRPAVRGLEEQFGASATVDALRDAASKLRGEITAGENALDPSAVVLRIEALATSLLAGAFRASLKGVINATGVILHTNLGRAPLPGSAIDRIATVAGGYSNLEYDLEHGERGRRDVHGETLLTRLTGAEAAVVVNNNAAATLLTLAALAAGREVVVSRGELVEIGGGFRVPDVMTQSGAALREVGTTNKTRTADYAAAISERTALILRVHPSNFTIEGFTERPTGGELVHLARRLNILVVEDLGSGHLEDDPGHPLAGVEPSVRASIAQGIDVCCFSGDKIFGGPQAGIIVGRENLIERIRRHPLMRALRVDKTTYAALEATLAEYASGRASVTIPVQRMLHLTAADIRLRAEDLASALNQLPAWRAELLAGSSAIGGGSAPGVELPTWLVAVEKRGLSADALESRLRQLTPAVVARIANERVVFDLRTVLPSEDATLRALLEAL